MAKAKFLSEIVVELGLTNDEAVFIQDLLYNVGGNPDITRRKIADDISDALGAIGIRSDNPDDIDGMIYFKVKQGK